MDILFRLLMVFEAVVCFLLIGIVLIQRSKGQGAGLSFGGGAEAVFGAQMGNVLTRITVVLAVLFLGNTTLLTVLRPSSRGNSLAERLAKEPASTVPAAMPAPVVDPEMARQTAAMLDTMETDATRPEGTQTTAASAAVPGDAVDLVEPPSTEQPPAAAAEPPAAVPAPEPAAAE